METLTTQQLANKLEDEDLLLLNVLDEDHFDAARIPGSDNLPLSSDDFVRKAQAIAGDKQKTIVVYCSGPECNASPTAARLLDEAGFSNVYDYEGGLKEWTLSGRRVERNGDAAA
ncbi:MAG: rhodanese-like domain-containing protein [Gemmatimonadales bacterium]|jgi:rhodanese-related sulfurtransferase